MIAIMASAGSAAEIEEIQVRVARSTPRFALPAPLLYSPGQPWPLALGVAALFAHVHLAR